LSPTLGKSLDSLSHQSDWSGAACYWPAKSWFRAQPCVSRGVTTDNEELGDLHQTEKE